MIAKIENLQQELLDKNSTMLLTFGFTDMFALIFLLMGFVVREEGRGIIAIISGVAGCVISGVIINNVTTVQGKYEKESMAGKYRYFPVNKKAIRRAQYALAFKIIGIQMLFCMLPVILTVFHFSLVNTLVALITTAVSMILVSVVLIEINLISYSRK